MRVMIIGGGIGGLCLAHGLRGAGIDVGVYERTRARTDWLQGYRIHINPDGCRALHRCLPARGWAAFDSTAGDAGGGFGFYDRRLRRLALLEPEMLTPAADDPVGRHRSVSRMRLREVLLDGLGEALHEGREFVRYEHTEDGRLRAHFADGGTAVGDLLVGADGANSRVRQQYLPELRRFDTGVVAIAGRYPLTAESEARLPVELTSGAASILTPRSDSLFAATWRGGPRTGVGKAGSVDTGDYVLWGYSAARSAFPPDLHDLDGEALRALVSERIDGWADALRILVTGADLASVNALALKSMPTLRPWPSTTVTLIGDAIHNMTPMAGIGANTALRDAAVLTRALTDAGPDDVLAAVTAYEEQMRGYANRAIAQSLRNARQAASDARLPRLAFGTTLKIAQAVPPLKRALFAGLGS
ncbi:FAD-dependent oxidoreductase [Pseudonocardia acaciae]|uniref:FAD-dependent oxidoreductase n=1 Tax=Pseudonocardia acaciae TaxID=551276 RepID=UPI0004905EF8|nr:NAD(P)/FAD-dependent oxidoreductase [Pseudonocardia acaciae]